MKTQAQVYDEIANNGHTYKYDQNSVDKIRNLVPPDKKVLDIGCGTGHLAQMINRPDWYGIDISTKSIQVAKQYYKEAKVGDITKKIDYSDNSFDVVLSISTLHHVPNDLEKVLSEIYRVLVPGGVLYAVEHDAENIKAFLTHHPKSPIRIVPCKDERALYKKELIPILSQLNFQYEFIPYEVYGEQQGGLSPIIIRLFKAPFVLFLGWLTRNKKDSFLLIAKKV